MTLGGGMSQTGMDIPMMVVLSRFRQLMMTHGNGKTGIKTGNMLERMQHGMNQVTQRQFQKWPNMKGNP